MRLLHVIAGARVGGAETFAQDAIAALHERSVAQRVLARPHAPAMSRYASLGVGVEAFSFSPLDRALGRGRAIRAAARAMQADLVHAWMSRAASFIPPRMPCPVIGWYGDYYDRKYFRRADFHFCVTPDIARHVVAHGARPHRVFTVNTFGTMPEAPPVSRASLDTPEGVPVLLALARLHPVKGIDTLLQALTEVPDARLWIAGDGPKRQEYGALAERLGLAGRVHFLGWRDDRKALLAACDICVLPSRHEPFGTVIVEAWAMRRPLVATLADGARQYVTDGVTGLLCPIDAPAALADCLRRAIADEGLRRDLTAAGYRAYRADFTREVVIERLLAAYAECLRLGALGRDRLARVAAAGGSGPERVARAYASAAPALAADAALLQLAGPGSLLSGRHVLLLGRSDLDRALGFVDRTAALAEHAKRLEAILTRIEPLGAAA